MVQTDREQFAPQDIALFFSARDLVSIVATSPRISRKQKSTLAAIEPTVHSTRAGTWLLDTWNEGTPSSFNDIACTYLKVSKNKPLSLAPVNQKIVGVGLTVAKRSYTDMGVCSHELELVVETMPDALNSHSAHTYSLWLGKSDDGVIREKSSEKDFLNGFTQQLSQSDAICIIDQLTKAIR